MHCPGQALSDATSSEYWLLPSIDSCGVGLPLTYPTADDPTGFVRLVGDDADLSDCPVATWWLSGEALLPLMCPAAMAFRRAFAPR